MLQDLVYLLLLINDAFLLLTFAAHGMLLREKDGIDTKTMRYDKEEKSWIF